MLASSLRHAASLLGYWAVGDQFEALTCLEAEVWFHLKSTSPASGCQREYRQSLNDARGIQSLRRASATEQT